MATTLGFKDILDQPRWRQHQSTIGNQAAGSSLSYDMRNNWYRHPMVYLHRSAVLFDVYNPLTDEWVQLTSPALAGTFAAGANSIFHPTQGPRGTLTTGSDTTKVVISTALPAAVGVNQLANRGDGRGFVIRIIGNAGAGSSGKVEEREIIANTAGTQPTIWVTPAFSFSAASGDAYEILSGRVFLLDAGVLAAGMFKYYDIATNSYSGNLSTTNLIATIATDSAFVALSEHYVPNDQAPSEGFIDGAQTADGRSCIVATAADATTITGSAMPSTLATNEYRNFQIRIVEDTTTPAAAGQRRNITSHTSGATGVFTVPAWTTNPSATAKFVIENNDDRILLRTSASTNVYNYSISGNAWDASTTWGAGGTGNGAGNMAFQSFGITRETTGNARHSFVYFVRGAATTTVDVLDIAGAATGAWSAGIVYGNLTPTITTGASYAYDPITNGGKYVYISQLGTLRHLRFDLRNRVLTPFTALNAIQGTAVVGQRMAGMVFIDGTTKLFFALQQTAAGALMYSIAAHGGT